MKTGQADTDGMAELIEFIVVLLHKMLLRYDLMSTTRMTLVKKQGSESSSRIRIQNMNEYDESYSTLRVELFSSTRIS